MKNVLDFAVCAFCSALVCVGACILAWGVTPELKVAGLCMLLCGITLAVVDVVLLSN